MASSEADLVSDLECSPHPWRALEGCGRSRRSHFEGPRVVPHLVYQTASLGDVLASNDGSIYFRRELRRVSTRPGWIESAIVYVDARLGAGDSQPQDYPAREQTCFLAPSSSYRACDAPIEALDAAGNIVELVKVPSTDGLSTVWALKVMTPGDRQVVETIRLPLEATENSYARAVHPLRSGRLAVTAESTLLVVDPTNAAVVACSSCDLRGVYGDDVLVARSQPGSRLWDEQAWWTPATNTFKVLPLPSIPYSPDSWHALGVLSDGSVVLHWDPLTANTAPAELTVVQRSGALRSRVVADSYSAYMSPLSSGDFLFNGHARVTPQGSVVWSVLQQWSPAAVPIQPLAHSLHGGRPAVDGKDVTYVVADEYDTSGRTVGRHLKAVDATGATVWTYDGPGLGGGVCSVGIAAQRRLFITCNRLISIFRE